MGDEASHTTRDPRAAHDCPVCGQPLATTATRHKVLGAWVPEWEVHPCRNPDCGRPVAGAEAASAHVTGKNGEIGRSQATG
ncbi:hypothetical protein ACFVVP_01180 [Streptomyces sp. NPDC058128]|uniref:hypothetical protein n=1 Tax=unclassified Streptomyces TaxID=2593676 RepID=UPI00093C087F|nr:hypothetical protein [Streptomyces sp. CB02009]OKJ56829.1 hypothetical protein AMK27_24250 [Streptomyces sp. CB02009]